MKRFVCFVIALALFSGCVSKDKKDLTIAGSTTVQPIVTRASEVYYSEHPSIRIGVEGGGSGTGINMVAEGSVGIGASSRELNKEEKTKEPDLVTTTVAIDCIAVVVNPSNTVKDLSLQQVRDIFSGKIKNYREVGGPDRPIVLVEREDGSGTRSMFESMVMGKTDVSDGALQKPASGAIRFTVAGNENAIGYVGIGYLDDSIKAVSLNGSAPNEENVRNKEYPLSRNLYLITKGPPQGISKDFIDYILSPEGQDIVKQEGFIKIKE